MQQESKYLSLLSMMLVFAGVLAVISIFMRYGNVSRGQMKPEQKEVIIEPTD